MEQIKQTRPIAPVLPAAKDPYPKQGEVKPKQRESEQEKREHASDDDHQLDEYA